MMLEPKWLRIDDDIDGDGSKDTNECGFSEPTQSGPQTDEDDDDDNDEMIEMILMVMVMVIMMRMVMEW